MSKKKTEFGANLLESDILKPKKCQKTIYRWEYPNGKIGYARLWTEKPGELKFGKLHYGTRKSYQAWREKYFYLRKKDLDFCGLDAKPEEPTEMALWMRGMQQKETSQAAWFTELRRFLCIHAEDGELLDIHDIEDSTAHQRAMLMAMLFSGYVTRTFVESGCACEHSNRNPSLLMRICPSKGTYGIAGDFAAQAAESFCVDTSISKWGLYFCNPAYFPATGSTSKTIENAYIAKHRQQKMEKRLPPIYQDTSVILNTRFMDGAEPRTFIRGNPWCAVLLLGKKDVCYDGVLELDPEKMEMENRNWDAAVLKKMSRSFVNWLRQFSFKNRKTLMKRTAGEARNLLDTYGDSEKDIRGGDRYYWMLLVMSMLLVVEFLDMWYVREEMDYDRALLINLLLPGCCPIPPVHTRTEGQKVISEADYPELFRKAMIDMLSETERFLYVPRDKKKNLCPKYAEDDESFQYYGYRRWFEQKGMSHRAAVFFLREEFLEKFAQFLPNGCDARTVLEFCEDRAVPEYFAPQKKGSRKARIPRSLEDKNSEESVILMLDKLDFLPEELHIQLMEPFRTEKDS